MAALNDVEVYTPAQAAAVVGLSLPAIHKAIEHKLIRPLRIRRGRTLHRMLSRAQLIYLRMEARGLTCLPVAERRRVAHAIERNDGIDSMLLSDKGVILIDFKSARRQVDEGLRRLSGAGRMIESDPEIMGGAPVYKGTRIPVELIADMLTEGTTPEEILEGYPALNLRKIELARIYVRAFRRRGRPAARPWAKRPPRRVTKHTAAG